MAKKTKQIEVQVVRRETMYMVAVLALAVGFFGGVVFSVLRSDSSPPGQTVAPVQSSPVPQANLDLSAGIAVLEKAVAANPDDVNAWIKLGNNYFDTDQYEKSIQAYRKSLAINRGLAKYRAREPPLPGWKDLRGAASASVCGG